MHRLASRPPLNAMFCTLVLTYQHMQGWVQTERSASAMPINQQA